MNLQENENSHLKEVRNYGMEKIISIRSKEEQCK